jgi:hypothetical protein
MKNQVMAVATFNGISGVALLTKAGKQSGVRMAFDSTGGLTASAVRTQLKGEGLKGRELTRKVNEVLCGETDLRWAKHEAAVSVLRSSGYVPDYVDARKGGATARFFKPKPVVETEITQDAALAALGLTAEQFQAMLAK